MLDCISRRTLKSAIKKNEKKKQNRKIVDKDIYHVRFYNTSNTLAQMSDEYLIHVAVVVMQVQLYND